MHTFLLQALHTALAWKTIFTIHAHHQGVHTDSAARIPKDTHEHTLDGIERRHSINV